MTTTTHRVRVHPLIRPPQARGGCWDEPASLVVETVWSEARETDRRLGFRLVRQISSLTHLVESL